MVAFAFQFFILPGKTSKHSFSLASLCLSFLFCKHTGSAADIPLWPRCIRESSTEPMTNELPKPPSYRYGYESASERWLPVRTPESILISVISMLSSPNDESPANLVRLWKIKKTITKKNSRPDSHSRNALN